MVLVCGCLAVAFVLAAVFHHVAGDLRSTAVRVAGRRTLTALAGSALTAAAFALRHADEAMGERLQLLAENPAAVQELSSSDRLTGPVRIRVTSSEPAQPWIVELGVQVTTANRQTCTVRRRYFAVVHAVRDVATSTVIYRELELGAEAICEVAE